MEYPPSLARFSEPYHAPVDKDRTEQQVIVVGIGSLILA